MMIGSKMVLFITRTVAQTQGLVPCILELGGKNPVIVTKSCDLKTTVRKLIDAKFQVFSTICSATSVVRGQVIHGIGA